MSPEGDPLPCIENPADGTQIPLRDVGRGEVLLLLHGWTLDHRSFSAQEPLAAHCRLVSMDRRGAGQSTAPPDLGAETGDLLAVIDHLGVERVHLLGVSQGARVALRFAALHPERLQSLILQGAAVDGFVPPVEDDSGIPLDEYTELARSGDLATLRQRWLAHPLMSSETLTASQQAELESMVNAYQGRDLLAGAPAASAIPNLLQRLAAFSSPVLIISGERETAARQAHAEKLLHTLPHAQERVLADCGHLGNFSQPEVYNRTVLEFIAGQTR